MVCKLNSKQSYTPVIFSVKNISFYVGRFHAKEYPAYDKEIFPYNMGYCQIGKVPDNIFYFR